MLPAVRGRWNLWLASVLGALALSAFLVLTSVSFGGGTTFEGTLEVVHGDNFASGQAQFRYRLITDEGALRLQFADQQPELPRSTKVRVRGTRTGNSIDVAPGGLEASGGAVAAVTGTKKVAVILFNFSGDASQPYTPAYAQGIAFSNPDSVAAYYAENTWNQLALSGDVFGWYTIPSTNTDCDWGKWGTQADQAATAAGVNLDTYDYIVYASTNAPYCGFAGLAYLPGNRSWLNGAGGMSVYVMAHELGHNFATHHSSSLNCFSGAGRVPLAATMAGCTADEYGDPFSVMGSGNRLHTNFSRGNIGWLTPANTKDVTVSGLYQLSPVESFDPNGVKALRIQRAPGSYLLLEYRQPYGTHFDNFAPSDPVVNGVTVRVVDDYSVLTQSKLVDTTASTATFLDASLGVDKDLVDPKTGVKITTLTVSPTGALVLVNLVARDPVAPTAPTNLTASAAGSTINLSWGASTDNVVVLGYRIYRNGTFLTATTSTSYSDAGLPSATTFSYYVRAFDAAGNLSAPSNTATATTPGTDSQPPTAPTGLTALKVGRVPGVTLQWGASTDNVGVTTYWIYRDGQFLTSVSGTALSYVDQAPAGTHGYYVVARDAAGNQSPPSNTATIAV